MSKIIYYLTDMTLIPNPSVGTKVVAYDLDGVQKEKDHSGIITPIGFTPHKVYTALLSQSSTDAPTAIVLQNTIGNIVWSYFGTGLYKGTLSGAFTANKTWAICSEGELEAPLWTPIIRLNANEMLLESAGDGFLNEDGALANAAIEIRVYN